MLDHVSGYIKPGRVCALMGASGAGKSTREFPSSSLAAQRLISFSSAVLNVLAGRKIGVVRGTVLVDGQKPDEEFYRTTGFVEQFDLHGELSLSHGRDSSLTLSVRKTIDRPFEKLLSSPPSFGRTQASLARSS